MGCGATRELDRVAVAFGLSKITGIEFERASDIPQGGVLLALPALMANGLLQRTSEFFKLPAGYYELESIFLLLALMALARIKSIEQLRYSAPGEWGKLLGLDRVPEVRTLRKKLKILCAPRQVLETAAASKTSGESGQAQRWSATLAVEWMSANLQSAGIYYVDGHVRVYHGEQTKLPRRYVARERLCLRGTTDYWINALDGQPFFCVNQPIDPGMLKMLREEIIPRLERDVPHQPSPEERVTNGLKHRFTIVFDREGYSPDFFLEMKSKSVAVLTYHKFPGENWSEEEFAEYRVPHTPSGNEVTMRLAERGVRVGDKIWMREIRKLGDGGHQTSILSTDYGSILTTLAVSMFSRWSQENFFKYMREHYSLDRLVEYGTEEIPGTLRVVNPRWREVDGKVRSEVGKLQRSLALFGGLQLDGDMDSKKVERYQQKKAELLQDIQHRKTDVEKLKQERKQASRHITVGQLEEKDRFKCLKNDSKHFMDTIKLIAYRAETAMAQIVREKMARIDDARALLRDLYGTEVDLEPDTKEKTLTVQLHHLATRAHDETLRYLCDQLTATETTFPGTDLRLIYKLGSP